MLANTELDYADKHSDNTLQNWGSRNIIKMALNDTLANLMSKMQNALGKGKNEIVVKPISKVMLQVLELLKAKGYIDSIEVTEDGRGNFVTVTGFTQINKCDVIKPRHAFKVSSIVATEQQYLPAKNFGVVIVSTNQGLMTLQEARDKHLGGKLIAYCY